MPVKFFIKGQEESTTPVITPGVNTSGGYIWLTLEDHLGNSWNVVGIDAFTGRLILCNNLPDNIGLDVSQRGKIKLQDAF